MFGNKELRLLHNEFRRHKPVVVCQIKIKRGQLNGANLTFDRSLMHMAILIRTNKVLVYSKDMDKLNESW